MDMEVLPPPPALASTPARTSAQQLGLTPARAAPGTGASALPTPSGAECMAVFVTLASALTPEGAFVPSPPPCSMQAPPPAPLPSVQATSKRKRHGA